MYRHFFKRVIDIFFSFLMLIIISPILLLISLAVAIDSRGPIVFKQKRLGLNGKEFYIHKFRTMVVGAEQTGSGVYSNKGDKRVTRVGKFLRATSLDELLQLWDVFIGKMSFIGPRPPLTYHPWPIEEYTDEQRKMFNARPGITGYAQINGRKEVEWHKRIELNVWYVEHLSFWLDIKILFKTVFKVFSNANNENKGETLKKEIKLEPGEYNLKLMYITNKPKIATIAENAGVDRIFVDMEYIGKSIRQGGMDTVQSHHTELDVKTIAKTVKKAEVLVRVNPIHQATKDYTSSKQEIDAVIKNGADIVMLPYFKTKEEVEEFINIVNGRVKTMLLLETKEAAEIIDDILEVKGIDFIHIGINDLSLSYGKKFMFEMVADGTVEKLSNKIKEKNIPFGFGGTARLGTGILPAEYVIAEHHNIRSSMVILSRSFCNTDKITNLKEVKEIFDSGIKEIRDYEKTLNKDQQFFTDNKQKIVECVNKFLEAKQ